MLTLPASVRIFVAAESVNLRRGFDGLAAATRSVIDQDPLSGHVFSPLEPATRPHQAARVGSHRLSDRLQPTVSTLHLLQFDISKLRFLSPSLG